MLRSPKSYEVRDRRSELFSVNASITRDRECLIEAGMDDYISLSPPQLSERIRLLTSASVLGKDEKQFEQPEDMVFDRDALLTRVDGDMTLLNEVVGIFLADYPNMLSKIENAVVSRDPKDIEASAHVLKGSAASIGANRLSIAALKLETTGRDGPLTDAARLYRELELEGALTQKVLGLLERGSSGSGF
jgi:HPt (histidine-containing phosphotransfer) domain-containing protein